MRPYERSHPWLKFSVDLSRAPAPMWMRLGEAQSKCFHIAGVPLPPTLADDFQKISLAKGAFATTAIEGNTLSEEQVRERIEGKLKLPRSKEYLGKEVDNVISAINDVATDVMKTRSDKIVPNDLMAYNKKILSGLPLEDGVVPGKISDHRVTVGRYLGAPREDCAYLLDRLCNWLNGDDFKPRLGDEIAYALLRAIIAHLYIAWIHPFGDGNGRVARLVEFKILLAAGVPASCAHLLSNHYNETRSEYYRQLDAASRSGGDVQPFVQYAVSGFVDGLREQVETIRVYQWDMTWRHHVHESFRDKQSATDIRRRHLALDLSARHQAVPLLRIPDISARTAKAYANKTQKTVRRDLDVLIEMKLVKRTKDGYVPRLETGIRLLPPTARPLELLGNLADDESK